MGLLDSVLGAALGGGGNAGAGGGGGAQGALLNAVIGMLSQGGGGAAGGLGGLGGLVSAFTKGGMGDAVNSWVGHGANMPVSADQVTSAQSITRQQTEQRNAEVAAEGAYDIAVQRYRAGLGNYLQVLTAETTVLAQRRLAVDLAARALDTQVSLARALGGGYQPPVNTAAAATN